MQALKLNMADVKNNKTMFNEYFEYKKYILILVIKTVKIAMARACAGYPPPHAGGGIQKQYSRTLIR